MLYIKYLLFFFFLLFHIQSFAYTDKDKEVISTMDEKTKVEFDHTFMEGVRCKILGDFKSALVCFERCMKLYDGSAAVRYEIANILAITNYLDNSLRYIREAVRLEPDNMWYRILQANIFRKKSMIEEACNVYHELTLRYPEREDFYFIQIELYTSIEKWEKAIEALDRYEKQFGTTEIVLFEKAKLYTQMKEIKKASTQIIKLIKKHPGQSDYLGLLAELYLNNNQEKKGLQVLHKLIKKDPSNGFVLFYLADYYAEKNDTLNTRTYLQKAFLNDDDDSRLKVQYFVKLLMNREKYPISDKNMKSYLQLLLDKYNDDLSVRTLNADILRQEKKLDQSVKELEFVISKEKNNFFVWENLLLGYSELNDTIALKEKALECLQYFPNEPLPYLMISFPLLVQKKYQEAIDYMKKGVELVHDNSLLKFQFYASLGDTYYALDSVKKAFQMYDEALKINSNSAYVLNNYAYFLAIRNERLEDAERMSSIAISIEPNNATFMDTYAWVLFKRKNYSLAKYCMKEAISKSEKPSGVMFEHYGDILYYNGEKEEAVKMWKKALELKDDECGDLEYKIKNGLPENEK